MPREFTGEKCACCLAHPCKVAERSTPGSCGAWLPSVPGRLSDKGLLKTSKIGRRNEYTAIVSEADYQAAQTQTLLNKLYEGNAKGLVCTLIQREMISEGDYDELKKFWESGEQKR